MEDIGYIYGNTIKDSVNPYCNRTCMREDDSTAADRQKNYNTVRGHVCIASLFFWIVLETQNMFFEILAIWMRILDLRILDNWEFTVLCIFIHVKLNLH
jgi:hypothetical protein